MSRRAALLLLVAAALLVLHAVSFLPFLSDDALISLRYAERLLDGRGLTWTDGERVEGYSNLLWLLACAGLGAPGLDLVVAARVLGFACSLCTLLVVARYSARGSAGTRLPGAAAAVVLALCGPLAAWTVGGLEQPLVALLLAIALGNLLRALAADNPVAALGRASAALALLCWTRPDGALFTAAACAGWWLAAPGPPRRRLAACLRIALPPAGAYLLQLLFRVVYYGDWLPNPAYAKLSLTPERLGEGALYLGLGAVWLAGAVVPAVLLAALVLRADTAPAGAAGRVAARRRVLLLAAPIVFWAAYMVAIGGDGFPARRHWVALLVPLAFSFAEGIARLSRAGRPRAARAATAAALLLLAAQAFDPQNRRARLERWEWDGAAVGRFLRDAYGERQPLLAVDPAGTLPYFSRLPALDMLGINDRWLAHHRPADFGHGPLGHELGDGDYVLGREPDLVVFCGPTGSPRPCFRSGKQMVRDARFRSSYRPARIVVDDTGDDELRAMLWLRAEGGRLGIRREDGRVRVPAVLLSAGPASAARLGPDGQVVLPVDDRAPVGYPSLQLGPGGWQMRVEHEGGPLRTAVRRSGERGILARGAGELEFRLESGAPAAVDLQIAVAPGGSARIVRIDLVRAAEEVIN